VSENDLSTTLDHVHKSPPVALTIAGSDSGGGAGIQADLKTFAAHHVFGTSAITAITAQNTVGVHAIEVLPTQMVRAQVNAVASDFMVRGVKTGMLATAEIVSEVADLIAEREWSRVVVDPVMVAASGDRLVAPDAVYAYREDLLQRAYLVTPNIPETEALCDGAIDTVEDMVKAARELYHRTGAFALVKGGHRQGEDSLDILFDGLEIFTFVAKRVESPNVHGTGCTLSSAICANLVRGMGLHDSIREAKLYVTAAIRGGSDWALGRGSGPLDHFVQVRHHH
jgi:hydroxymethylpyrimidine/phosphomethylpyrimidine kinase